MARGVNKVILLGHLGADPESRNTSTGTVITNIRLATTERWRDRQSGEQQERTEWHRVVCFGRLGEIAAEYLTKGRQCYVEGRIQTRKWQGQDGQDRYTTEIVALDMQMVGSRNGDGAPQRTGPEEDRQQHQQQHPHDRGGQEHQQQRQEQRQDHREQHHDQGGGHDQHGGGQRSQGGGAPPRDDFDDDIPF